eukprot:s37_g10.t2
MVYTLYGNAVLDLTIFISPGSIAVPDLIEGKFKCPKGELKEMKEHFCAVGGFSFLLHGAVRFCAGYFKSKEMVCLAIFSYFLEVAQIGTLLLTGVFRGAVSQEFIKLRKASAPAPRKSTSSIGSSLLRTFGAANQKVPLEHPDPEEAGVVIIATGGRSFSLLFPGGSSERDGFAEPGSQRPADQRISGSADQRISGSADQRTSGPADQRISGSADQRISGSASGSADQRISGSASGSADQRISQRISGSADQWTSGQRTSGSADQRVSQRISGSATGSADQRISGPADQRISGSASGAADQPADQPADQRISRPADQRISGSADQRISGSADQRTSGSADQRISGSADQRISGSADQRISGSADQRMSGPADQRTSGPVDQRTRGPADQRTSGSADQRILAADLFESLISGVGLLAFSEGTSISTTL